MNISEVGKLLTVASAIDNRTVDMPAVQAWHDLVGDVDYESALAALREFRKSMPGVYLEPGHIISGVKRLAPRSDNGIARPPAPAGKTYAVDVIEYGAIE